MQFHDEEKVWLAICAGRLCRLCEAELPAVSHPGMRFCSGCVPPGSAAPHAVMLSVDHHHEGWCVQLRSEQIPPFTYWLIGVTRDRMTGILQRMPMAPSQRGGIDHALRSWGRSSLHVYLDQQQYNRLLHAYRRDPRNGDEKQRSVATGA